MPSRIAQERLLLRAHEEVGLNPNETPVVEANHHRVPLSLNSLLTLFRVTELALWLGENVPS